MTILLICGSRDATPTMLNVAVKAVIRAQANGWRVLCGDAEGIDHAVMAACCKGNVPFAFYGTDKVPRHFCCQKHLTDNYHRIPWSSLDRDKFMVEASDRVFGIWQGQAAFTVQYARTLKKQVDVWEPTNA